MSEQTNAKATSASNGLLGLEKWLDELVNNKQPLQLPVAGRKWIAENSWWLAIVGGVVSLWGAWSFWQLGHAVDSFSQYANELAHVYGSTTYASELGPMWYVALAGLVVEGVMLLMAVSALKAHKKSGWNMLFYVSLVNLIVGLVYLLVPSYGAGGLFGTLLGAAIGWFFLFQVRSRFTN